MENNLKELLNVFVDVVPRLQVANKSINDIDTSSLTDEQKNIFNAKKQQLSEAFSKLNNLDINKIVNGIKNY